MKQYIRHIITSNLDEVVEKSFLNCHLERVHSIMISDAPEKMISAVNALETTFIIDGEAAISASLSLLLIPFFMLLMAGLGLGFGLIFTSMTTKYRDLQFLIQFGVQLLMYATPIIYPMSLIEGKLKMVISLNPLAHIVEAFKYSFLGRGELSFYGLAYATVFTIVVLIAGILIFNRTERNFVDTV